MMEEFYKNLAHELETQDNRITAHPLFCVLQKRKIYGLDPQYDYDGIFRDNETGEISYYKEINTFMTGCLTEKAAQEYIRINGHNLDRPFIYAFSAYRNEEMIQLQETIGKIAETLEKKNHLHRAERQLHKGHRRKNHLISRLRKEKQDLTTILHGILPLLVEEIEGNFEQEYGHMREMRPEYYARKRQQQVENLVAVVKKVIDTTAKGGAG